MDQVTRGPSGRRFPTLWICHLEETMALPHVAVTADFTYLEGWWVRERSWQEVPLRDVLDRTGLEPAAWYVAVYAADHNGEHKVLLDRDQALALTSILALAKDGNPLSHGHGVPLRLQVAGADCFVQVKWLMRMEALVEPVAETGRKIALDRLQKLKG